MVTQKITINLTQSRLAPIIMRSEEKGREIQFEVIDEAGEPEDLTSYSLKYMQLKPDGNVVYADLASGILTQTEQMATSKGKGYYCIRIMDDDTIIYSGQGPVIIDDHVIDDETLESISEVNGLIFPDDFLTDEDMGDYVTDDELETSLSDYVTNDGLSTELSGYATQEYVNEAISHIQTLDVYSTEEKAVGTWIDGSTLYAKTISGTITITSQNRTWYEIISASDMTNILKVNKIWVANGSYIIDPQDGSFYNIPSATGPGSGFAAAMKVDDGAFKMVLTNISTGSAEYCITIQYTKTT